MNIVSKLCYLRFVEQIYFKKSEFLHKLFAKENVKEFCFSVTNQVGISFELSVVRFFNVNHT